MQKIKEVGGPSAEEHAAKAKSTQKVLKEADYGAVAKDGAREGWKYVLQARTEGITSRTLEIKLRRNAVVSKFDVVVQAARADITPIQNAAQVRPGEPTSSGSGINAFVLDFGTPRTVSSVSLPSDLAIQRITAWIGSSFAPTPAWPPPEGSSTPAASVSMPEIRSERLLVEVTGSLDLTIVASDGNLILPESPSGLELRIDTGAPVWTHPAAAQGGAGAAITDQAWNTDGKRLVHLADAFAKLTGDPMKDEEVTFQLVLTSRVPGVLDLSVDAADWNVTRRMDFGGDTAKTLKFDGEGIATLPLTLPAPLAGRQRSIAELRATAIATLPPERILPAVGPPPAGGLADLVLNPDRAACVRISGVHPFDELAQLTGIRLPLQAGDTGAEARVVLWSNKGGGAEQPLDVIPDATSDPVTLPAATSEDWFSFRFKTPVAFDPTAPPWAALLVTRGEVTWTFGATSGASDLIDLCRVRVGPPAGPWKLLPPPFEPPGSLSAARGRCRLMGLASRDHPIAPLRLDLVPVSPAGAAAAGLDVTPTAKGAPAGISARPAFRADQLALVVTSRAVGEVTLRDIDVISTA